MYKPNDNDSEIHTFRKGGLLGLGCEAVYQETDQRERRLEVRALGQALYMYIDDDAASMSCVGCVVFVCVMSSTRSGTQFTHSQLPTY